MLLGVPHYPPPTWLKVLCSSEASVCKMYGLLGSTALSTGDATRRSLSSLKATSHVSPYLGFSLCELGEWLSNRREVWEK